MWLSGKESACQSRTPGFDPWVSWKIPWRRKWQPTAVFLPGKSHGQKILAATVHGVTKNQTQLSTQLLSSPITFMMHVGAQARGKSQILKYSVVTIFEKTGGKKKKFQLREKYHLCLNSSRGEGDTKAMNLMGSNLITYKGDFLGSPGVHASMAGGMSSTPSRGTKILHTVQHGMAKKNFFKGKHTRAGMEEFREVQCVMGQIHLRGPGIQGRPS